MRSDELEVGTVYVKHREGCMSGRTELHGELPSCTRTPRNVEPSRCYVGTYVGFCRLRDTYVAKCQIDFESKIYPSVEHAYQAAKTLDLEQREMVHQCGSSGKAKRLGRKITIRQSWDAIKLSVMEDLVRAKLVIPIFVNCCC